MEATLSPSPDNADAKVALHKSSKNAAKRKYRRWSPGGPTRERGSSPIYSRDYPTRDSESWRSNGNRRDLEKDSGRSYRGRSGGRDPSRGGDKYSRYRSRDPSRGDVKYSRYRSDGWDKGKGYGGGRDEKRERKRSLGDYKVDRETSRPKDRYDRAPGDHGYSAKKPKLKSLSTDHGKGYMSAGQKKLLLSGNKKTAVEGAHTTKLEAEVEKLKVENKELRMRLAHTTKLEAKVEKLKVENKELRKRLEELMEMQRNQEVVVTHDYGMECWGVLPPWKNEVYVRHFTDCELFCRAWYTSMVYTHPSLLRSISGHPDRFSIVYERYTEDFKRYVDYGIANGNWMEMTSHVGRQALLVHPTVKELLGNLINVLKYFHSNNVALGGFSFENIVMVDDTPKLVGVGVFPADNSLITADFNAIDMIISHIYRDKVVPRELKMLVEELGNWRDNGNNVYDHPSLWGSGRRLAFLSNVWDWQSFTSENDGDVHSQDYEAAFERVEDALDWYVFEQDWRKMVPAKSVMRQFLDSTYNASLYSLSRYLRNCLGHLAATASSKKGLFTQDEIDGMISLFLPGFLAMLETNLSRQYGSTYFTL